VPQSDGDDNSLSDNNNNEEDESSSDDDDDDDDGQLGEHSHAQMAYVAAVGRSPVGAAVASGDLNSTSAAASASGAGDKATNDNMQIIIDGNNGAINSDLKQVSPELLNQTVNGNTKNITTNSNNINNTENKKKKKRIKYSCPYDLDDRDDDENTPLHIAIHARKLPHIRLLLEAGASVHRKCDGSYPIHLAISIGGIASHADFSVECLKLLMEYGADVTMRDDSFHNPLYLGCVSNLARGVEVLLGDGRVVETVNYRADRVGGRALHAAARYDVRKKSSVSNNSSGGVGGEQEKSVMELLLGIEGIEVDAQNNYGRTPLHIAACRGNWNAARLLIGAGADVNIIDKRGFTPGQVAQKRGLVIPNDLLVLMMNQDEDHPHHPPASAITRDLIMDPDRSTLILCHELCIQHKTCPPIVRGDAAASEPPPENVRRLNVLINDDDGILRCDEFSTCKWNTDVRRAAMTDVLKVHEYTYIEKTSQLCAAIPDHPNAIQTLDADTTVSHWSFEAALRAAGSVCEAVDKVMSEEFRNAFCAIRPPGHHAGPRGIVTCPNDPDGSHGFCLLNNVAIGAAYARSMYRNDGIKKVAIVDFDVHHGNGTEEIVRQLTPNVEQHMIRTPFAVGGLSTANYKPWLDENDVNDVFFASTHGYGPRDRQIHPGAVQGGWFYPASGKTYKSKSLSSPSDMEIPSLSEFLMSQTWSRLGDEYRLNCCKIIDIGLSLPAKDDTYNHGLQRLELRDSYRKNVIPALLDFDPDMIFISAGFDAHRKDSMNFGYVGMIEEDYEWLTEQLVKVANTCCDGRIVSVLEGGYKIHGGIISPFARSVASHLRGLVDGGSSRETYDREEGEWESQFERHMHDEKEKRRQMKLEKLSRDANIPVASVDIYRQSLLMGARQQHDPDDVSHDVSHQEGVSPHHGGSTLDGEPSRKRRRNQVDYAQLYEQMKKEGRGDGI
jgi:acetoin utilization deacetylase AcuC-like enzyme/ankyrin repeat protein